MQTVTLTPDANLDTGAGTDNAPAIQALLDAGLPVTLPPGVYGIRSTLRMNPAVGRSLAGTYAGTLGPDDPSRGTWLAWLGANGGQALSLGGVKCRVMDLGIISASTTSLDRCIDVTTPSSYPHTSSQHTFERVVCDGRWGNVTSGWVVGEDQADNHELMQFLSCLTRKCGYAGVSCPNGTRQAKNWLFSGCTFGGPGQFGVVFNSGSACFRDCNWDNLGCWARWYGTANEPVTFDNCTGETCPAGVQGSGIQYLLFRSCRLNVTSAPNPQPLLGEWISGGQNLEIDSCCVEDPDGLVGWVRPADGGSLCVTATAFHSATPFSCDDRTRWRGTFRQVRVNQQNDLLPDGSYWQRNVPGYQIAADGSLHPGTHYPPPITFSGGIPSLSTTPAN